MFKTSRLLLVLLLSACGGGGSPPAAVAPPPTATQAAALPVVSNGALGGQQAANIAVDSYIQEKLVSGNIPGLSLAVIENGKLVYAKSYGYADKEKAVQARPEQRYEIGSITKSFVAVAVMMLVEEGKLGLDDRISKYIGPVQASWEAITIRQLLNHTSGLPEFPGPGFDKLRDRIPLPTEVEMLELAKQLPLNSRPGATWSYSNIGYDIVGLIVAKASGKPYGEFLQERVFTPLGMSDTRVMKAGQSTAGLATGYSMQGGKLMPEVHTDAHRNYLALAASGIESSVLDLAKFDIALRSESLLSAASRAEMWAVSALAARQTGNMRADVNYGLGWFLSTVDGHRKIYHSGGMPGFLTDFIRYPDAGISVAVLTNQGYNHVDPQVISRAVAKMYRPELPN
jgi:CubicO group peptidase (beta-lactamase class C family)